MKARKAVTILLCAALVFLLCACGAGTAEKKEEFASKEQFLEDMVKGLSDRADYMAEHMNDSNTRTDEEMKIYFHELVSLELAQIEKYTSLSFEDPLFHELAHAYIDACQMQRLAVQNYQSEDLRALWLSAGTIRGSIIREMHAHHDLLLPDKLAVIFIDID